MSYFVRSNALACTRTDQGEVRMVPVSPTATMREPDEATAKSSYVVSELRGVQVLPSGEVRMVPV